MPTFPLGLVLPSRLWAFGEWGREGVDGWVDGLIIRLQLEVG